MGLLTVLAFPLAPVRLVTAIGRLLQQEADRQRYSSAGLRRRLEALDSALASGELSEREHAEAQQAILDEVMVRSESVEEVGAQSSGTEDP